MKKELALLKSYIDRGDLVDAQRIIDRLLEQYPSEAELHFLLGKLAYKQQQWGQAINAFNQALDLDPDHSEAASNLEMANHILGYYTPDMFNP